MFKAVKLFLFFCCFFSSPPALCLLFHSDFSVERRRKKNNFQLILKLVEPRSGVSVCVFFFPSSPSPSLCLNKHLQIMLYIFFICLNVRWRNKNILVHIKYYDCVGKFMFYIIEAPIHPQRFSLRVFFPFSLIYSQRKFSSQF